MTSSKASRAAKKGWKTRLSKLSSKERRSRAAKKAWKTRKKRERQERKALKKHKELHPELIVKPEAFIKPPTTKEEAKEFWKNLDPNIRVDLVGFALKERLKADALAGIEDLVESDETIILAKLMAAEEAGILMSTVYRLADEYGWTPQEVYTLWISPD